MAGEYLGESFDIHCGGIDHVPVHHTNEIAQSEAVSGKTMAQIWMHGGFLVVDKEKMSKSTGGFLTLDKIKERGTDPIAYRLLCLGGSYRKELSWSWEALEGASKRLANLKTKFSAIDFSDWESMGKEDLDKTIENDLDRSSRFGELEATFKEAVFDDLSMSKGLLVLQSALDDKGLSKLEILALSLQFDSILGLGIDSWQRSEKTTVPDGVLELADKRKEARDLKDWALSDSLRDEIKELGWTIKDSADGFKLTKDG